MTINPDVSIISSAHTNNQSYADVIGIDLTGISTARIDNIVTNQWQTHFYLGFSPTSQTYKNVITSTRSWGGETGFFLAGSATRNGANANVIVGASTTAMVIHYRI